MNQDMQSKLLLAAMMRQQAQAQGVAAPPFKQEIGAMPGQQPYQQQQMQVPAIQRGQTPSMGDLRHTLAGIEKRR